MKLKQVTFIVLAIAGIIFFNKIYNIINYEIYSFIILKRDGSGTSSGSMQISNQHRRQGPQVHSNWSIPLKKLYNFEKSIKN